MDDDSSYSILRLTLKLYISRNYGTDKEFGAWTNGKMCTCLQEKYSFNFLQNSKQKIFNERR